MAPLLAACRLHVPRNLVVLVLILYFLIQSSSSIIVYDHQMLVNLQNLTKDWTATALQSPCAYSPPPVLLDIPAYLRRWHGDPIKRKRRMKRGRRGGTAVKRKLFWKDARLRQPCLRQLTRGHSWACLPYRGIVLSDHVYNSMRSIYAYTIQITF